MAKILVYGMGALGSVLSSYLSDKHDVYGVGREWHIGAIDRQGYLRINIVFNNTFFEANLKGVATRIEELEELEFDYILLTTKAFDLEEALHEILDSGASFKSIVLFQNGYGVSELAAQIIGARSEINVIRAVTYIGANISKPGEVNHAGLGETIMGSVQGENAEQEAARLCKYLNDVELPCKVVNDIRIAEFEKLVVNATINPITALLEIKNGQILESKELKQLVSEIVNEINQVAEKLGVKTKYSEDIVYKTAEKTKDNISSMLQDILKGRKTEIDYINGAIAKMGQKLGIKTPINQTIYRLVKEKEKLRNMRKTK